MRLTALMTCLLLLAGCQGAQDEADNRAANAVEPDPGGAVVEPPAAPSAQPQSAGPTPTIPTAFRGEWNADPSACGTGRSDSRLRIEAGRLRFYESMAEVKSVTVKGPGQIEVDASFSGEGQKWTKTFELQLSPSGDELTAMGMSRRRCP